MIKSKKTSKLVEKRWGHEKWFANNERENYCGKELFIDKDKHTSMHYHLVKHEVFYIIIGRLRLELIDTSTGEGSTVYLNVGDTYEIEQGQPHMLIAHDGPVTLIEASTYHRDEDSFRIHDNLSAI